MLKKRRTERRADTGAVTLLVLLMAGGMIAMIGLVYDGGRKIDGFRGANEIAMETARTAAQCVDVNAYLQSGQAVVQDPTGDGARAKACAQPYLSAVTSTLPSDTTVTLDGVTLLAGGTEVRVDVTITRPVVFLASLGFQNVAHGHATVKLTQGVTDAGG